MHAFRHPVWSPGCAERFPPNPLTIYLQVFIAIPIVLKARFSVIPLGRLGAPSDSAQLVGSRPCRGNLSISSVPVRPIRELPRLVGHLTNVEALPLARLAPLLSEHGRVGALEGNMRDVHEGDEETQRSHRQRYNV